MRLASDLKDTKEQAGYTVSSSTHRSSALCPFTLVLSICLGRTGCWGHLEEIKPVFSARPWDFWGLLARTVVKNHILWCSKICTCPIMVISLWQLNIKSSNVIKSSLLKIHRKHHFWSSLIILERKDNRSALTHQLYHVLKLKPSHSAIYSVLTLRILGFWM